MTSPTERVGRYQLLDPIGIGPSGTVSRAKVFGVAGFERQFAVKRFHAELTATAAMAAMLSAAARAYGSLEHPRIARMSEFGVAQGSTFTAVEYVHGLDVLRLIGEARLAGVTLAAGGALALVSQAARAVGYAHGRGLTHLGLAPTNVIVTAEGDIKITDFGILSATLPPRPIDVARLAQRIPYLAPEQLANEATSAATDVFALGVLAYELVTGNRTFKGETPQQIASAIMAGPPAEPLLPRPIVRVLQRCLARSPFERFPDARALADALDAALRVAPVPGTRKDIGVQVKDTLDRLAALNEGQMSGVVALHLGTGPIRRPDEDDGRPPAHEPPTLQTPATAYELAPPDLGAMASPAMTLPDLQRAPMTVPGVPPPPIPVPPGVSGTPGTPPQPPSASNTLLGLGGKTPPAIPAARFARPGSSAGLPARPPAVPAAALRPRAGTDLSIPIEPSEQAPGGLTNDSAIHPLDPGDLVPFEVGPGEADTVDAGTPLPDTAEPAPIASAQPQAPEAPVEAAPLRAADASESAQRRAASGPSSADATVPQQAPRISPAAPLFDPVVRSLELPRLFNLPPDAVTGPAGEPAPGPEDAREPVSAEAPPEPSAAGRPPSDTGPVPPDPRLGKTIQGFPAPPRPRPATPSPQAATEGQGEAGDELSGMALEGFRPAPVAPAPPSLPSWPHEGSAPHGDPSAPRHSTPYPPPPIVSPHPTPYPPPPIVSPQLPASPLPPDLGSPSPMAMPPPMSPPMSPATPMPHGASAPVSWGGGATSVPAPAMPGGPRPQRRMLWILVGMIGAVVVAIGGWQIYVRTSKPSGPVAGGAPVISPGGSPGGSPGRDTRDPRAATAADAQVATPGVASPPPGDATAIATATPDAGAPASARPPGGAPASVPTATAGDTLSISSKPPGARVFLDGSDAGATPVKLPGSPDRHTIALLLAGHELYVAEVDGRGTFHIPLKEVTPTGGPAGIKVLRCKDKDRYYVYVDGKPTGQTCPTERIGCELGPHTVEVYDVVSETRRKWDIVVKETRLSFRVRVE